MLYVCFGGKEPLVFTILIVKPISVAVEWVQSAIVSSSTNLTPLSLKEKVQSFLPL